MRPLVIFLALVTPQLVSAQVNNPAKLRVKYSFIHVFDTTISDQPKKETMQLLVAKNASKYSSYEFEEQYRKYDSARWQNTDADGTVHRGSNYPANYISKDKMAQYNSRTHKSTEVYNLVNQLFFGYEFDLPDIKWSITNEKRTISTISCRKAVGVVHGRKYEAWFAPSLVYTDGPWKLHGLPGLILEAYDQKRQVQFLFDGIEDVAAKNIPVMVPDSAFLTDFYKFNALMTTAKINLMVFAPFNRATPAMAEKLYTDNAVYLASLPAGSFPKDKMTVNNPVELDKKTVLYR